MSDRPQTPPGSEAAPDNCPEKASGRRRLLQGGLAAAPVLMTLISRPVLAQQCVTPSAFVSGNTSTTGPGISCTGTSPGYWKQPQHFSEWTAPFYPTTSGSHKATLFDSVLQPHYPGKTLLDVLDPQIVGGGPPNDLARYIIASMLNCAAGKVPVLTIPAIQAMWAEYITTGYYSPSSGVHWNHDDIVKYLLSTMS